MKVEFEKNIAYVLREMGISQDLLGYKYIKYAAWLIAEDDKYLRNITKDLYPTIAEKYQTKAFRVERAIRHAIEVCMDNIDQDLLRSIFGNTIRFEKDKPTNAHFLAAVSETIRFSISSDNRINIEDSGPNEDILNRIFAKWGRDNG